jgi:glycosyltransferase involved in cell wall biosynthesis
LREKFPKTHDKRIVLFLGRVCRQKGLDLLIKAFRKVVTLNGNVYLMIVGPEEKGYGERVRRWVSEESLGQYVTFVGPLYGRQKLAAYVDSDVFVLASYAENFGATVIEALACKRPVVISDRVNICDEIAGAEAGIVVNCSVESLANGIHRVLDDPNLAERLGKNGYELVKQKFTWDAALGHLIPIYRKLTLNQ